MIELTVNSNSGGIGKQNRNVVKMAEFRHSDSLWNPAHIQLTMDREYHAMVRCCSSTEISHVPCYLRFRRVDIFRVFDSGRDSHLSATQHRGRAKDLKRDTATRDCM